VSNFYPYAYLIWMLLSFSIYIFWIIVKFGVQPSISDSFYALQDKYGAGSLTPWLFWLFLINVAWPIFPLMHFSGFAFFAMAGIILVGAAARFRSGKSTETPHVVGAVGGTGLAFLAIGIVFGGWAWLWLPAFVIAAGVLQLIKLKNKIWWVEILAFIMIIIALFVHTT
jgi:hypothetical protein